MNRRTGSLVAQVMAALAWSPSAGVTRKPASVPAVDKGKKAKRKQQRISRRKNRRK